MTTTSQLQPTTTYAAAYAKVAAMAEKLRASGSATTVDTHIDDIRAARAAHSMCKSRLETVMKQFDAEVAGVEEGRAGVLNCKIRSGVTSATPLPFFPIGNIAARSPPLN